MKNNKESWIAEVLNSTQGMSRAQPRDGLFGRVMVKAGSRETTVIHLPVVRWAAAAILLLTLNVGSVIYSMNRNNETAFAPTENPLAVELQSSSSTYNY